MKAQSQKSGGLNLSPLAPAQSKRTFALSGKTRKSIEHESISGPERPTKKSQVWPQSRKTRNKMEPKDAQTEPKNQQIESQSASKYEKPGKCKGGKVEPQVLQ